MSGAASKLPRSFEAVIRIGPRFARHNRARRSKFLFAKSPAAAEGVIVPWRRIKQADPIAVDDRCPAGSERRAWFCAFIRRGMWKPTAPGIARRHISNHGSARAHDDGRARAP